MKNWKGVITHPKPHLDECVGFYILREYGEIKYPGIRDAILNRKALFLREGEFTMSSEKYEQDGYLLLGVGGGKFDEHATENNEGRKDGKCSAMLVAEDLGLERNPELQKLLRFVSVVDLGASAQPFDISSIVKVLHDQNPDDPWIAIDWVFTALSAKQKEQYDFHVVAAKASAEARREMIGNISLATVETDCTVVSKYLRTKEGGRADVIIQKSPTKGQVQIFTNNQMKIDTQSIAKLFRLLEHKAQKRTGEIAKAELIREGTIEIVPEWYYFEKAGSLLNGSQTAPNTPATKIPLPVITMAVRFILLRPQTDKELNGFVQRFRVR